MPANSVRIVDRSRDPEPPTTTTTTTTTATSTSAAAATQDTPLDRSASSWFSSGSHSNLNLNLSIDTAVASTASHLDPANTRSPQAELHSPASPASSTVAAVPPQQQQQPSSSSARAKQPQPQPQQQQQQRTPAVAPAQQKEPKQRNKLKKRGFFGIGGGGSSTGDSPKSAHPSSSPSQEAASSSSSFKGFFGAKRSSSTRTRPVSQQIEIINRGPVTAADSSPSSRQLRPDPIAEESAANFIANPSARPAPAAPRNPSYRHSIANPLGFGPSPASFSPNSPQQQQGPNSPSVSSLAGETTPGSLRVHNSAFNTSSTQLPDGEENGSKYSSAWSERPSNRAPSGPSPQSQWNPGYGAHSHYLNVNDSRPSSRQSLEPSSPSQSQQYIPYHPRGAASQSSISKVEISRDSSPLPQTGPPQRLQHSGQGSYGSSLDPDNPPRRPSRLAAMGQNDADAGAPPSKSKEDLASLDFPQLVTKHEELNDKYRKVKKYYFEKDAQVQQLQNTLAHQRLSQSRTSLDDNEYSNRFSRLDGAIGNLAFNVRKDWKAVPPWLSPYVNSDATTKATKEMTAVGRACISRWLVDEIFDRVFHPGLEQTLSSHLKIIERNLRRFAPPVTTDEERDALLGKISNWRLSTLDGLQEALVQPTAAELRTELTRGFTETLTGDLQMNLTNPPPAGLEAGVSMIIELAVGIAANLPLESRDVYVEYILPGIPYSDAYMKTEGTLPPLTNPGETYPGTEAEPPQQQSSGGGSGGDEAMGGEGMPPTDSNGQVIGGFVGAGPKEGKKSNGKKEDGALTKSENIRFAAFMSVMVKGKSMLVKAPVFM